MIEHNGVERVEEEGEFYFPCFDIVPYAENIIYKAASDPTTREMNRDILYDIYE